VTAILVAEWRALFGWRAPNGSNIKRNGPVALI
jgi:hypothetical protein